MLAMRPRGIRQADFLSFVFALDMRYIKQYRCKIDLQVPGLYMIDDLADRAIMSTRKTFLSKNDPLWARVDDREPDEIIVDTNKGCYKLTRDEWDKFRNSLVSMDNVEEL